MLTVIVETTRCHMSNRYLLSAARAVSPGQHMKTGDRRR